MTRAILIDTNTFVLAFDATVQDTTLITEAKQKIKLWLNDNDVRLATNPLIYFELLRSGKLSQQRLETIERVLSEFEMFQITHKDGDLAATLFRTSEQNGKPLGKRTFDTFNFACAVNNDLEIETNDGDLATIKKIYDTQNAKKNRP
jgi:predicted nucleic acid-binding protein